MLNHFFNLLKLMQNEVDENSSRLRKPTEVFDMK
jgi:hypothetical protein